MSKRDFLSIADLSLAEAREVLALAKKLKAAPKGSHADLLRGRSVCILLEKASTRTRISFEVGISQFGAQPVVFGVQGSQLARGEPIADTARVIERYCDLIVYRTFGDDRLREMAKARVPVINALSDEGHPVQILCDIFTIEEAFKDEGGIHKKRLSFVGDCSSNMARSWIEAAPLFGFHLVLAGPPSYRASGSAVERAIASGHVSIVEDPAAAARNCDVINTDVWTSMGQEAENAVRLAALSGWTVNAKMLEQAPAHAIVLHCLPAHRGEEIDHDTIEGPRSRVWDQAENRLHVQKALMLWLLGVKF